MISNQPYGMVSPFSESIDIQKYRQTGEDFYSKVVRISNALKDSPEHFEDFKDALRYMRFLPAGKSKMPWAACVNNTITVLTAVSSRLDDNIGQRPQKLPKRCDVVGE